MSLKEQLLQFVKDDLAGGPDAATIAEDTQLIESGMVDSMGLMRLITFVEERTGVRIPDDEVLPDNFQSIEKIEALVSRLRTQHS